MNFGLMKRLDDLEGFIEKYPSSGGNIESYCNHQLIPIFDATRNGLLRFLLGYAPAGGKSAIPLEILKQLNALGKKECKTLVVAPKQTLLENWNAQTMREMYGFSPQVYHVEPSKHPFIPADATFVTVNYHRLLPRLPYFEPILNFASEAGMVILDEVHNIKNRNAKITKSCIQMIEASKQARFVGLSASLCPDRMEDLGMALFCVNPDRYRHYTKDPYRVEDDPEALWELKEKGQLLLFDREQVAAFHNLPLFIEHEPKNVRMLKQDEDAYFEAYCELNIAKKLPQLERIAIEAMLNSPDSHEFLHERIMEGYVLNFFSHLRRAPKEGGPDEALFRKLELLVKSLGAKSVGMIHGEVGDRERLAVQAKMHSGSLDVLINQWNCSGEGFSEVAGHRKVLIIPLRSPWSPGMQIQMIGRPLRPGQYAPVEYIELHPHSERLLGLITEHVTQYAAENNLRMRDSWKASLFHHDAYKIRTLKQEFLELLINHGAYEITNTSDLIEVDSFFKYRQRLLNSRFISRNTDRDAFGQGIREGIRFVGTSYGAKEGLQNNPDSVTEDYDRDDIFSYTPGKINLFLAQSLENIKRSQGEECVAWKVADLGCSASAPFAQANLIWRAMLAARKENNLILDEIVNVDGIESAVKRAKEQLENKTWLSHIPQFTSHAESSEDMEKAVGLLKDRDYMHSLAFRVSNFARESFGSGYDAVITSQSLQYNDQEHCRDIEKIALAINHSLKDNGHYLATLTGNSATKSFTTPGDIASFRNILESSGFEIMRYALVEGRAESEIAMYPFHYFHARKRAHCAAELPALNSPLPMYSRMIECITGGFKEMRFRRSRVPKDSSRRVLPESYYDLSNNKPFNFYNVT